MREKFTDALWGIGAMIKSKRTGIPHEMVKTEIRSDLDNTHPELRGRQLSRQELQYLQLESSLMLKAIETGEPAVVNDVRAVIKTPRKIVPKVDQL